MGTQEDSSARIDAQGHSEALKQEPRKSGMIQPYTVFLPATVHIERLQGFSMQSIAEGKLKIVRGSGGGPMEAPFSFGLSVQASQQIKEIVRRDAERYIKAIQATQATDPYPQEDR